MVHLQPEFEGRRINESAADASLDNKMDTLSRYGGPPGVRGEELLSFKFRSMNRMIIMGMNEHAL